MKALRAKIDKLDAEIVKKISQRIMVAKKIGVVKAELQIKVLDKKRELQIAKLHQVLCKKYKLSPELIKKVFKIIILHSRDVQK